MYIRHYIEQQIEWSKATFGSDQRTVGLLKHIESELEEIRQNPDDLEEWIDVIILAIDGAWRAGYSAECIVDCLRTKQRKNLMREWPNSDTLSDDEPSFHIGE